jgi:3-hydroxyacyl-[acyl-carrier-protein] dehydratase
MSDTIHSVRKQLALRVPLEHPSYAGHFPDYPILPGVLCVSLAIDALQSAINSHFNIEQLNAAKFTAPIFPGDTLTLDYAIQGKKLDLVIYKERTKALSLSATIQETTAR